MENGSWDKANKRITAIDALRGFAVAAILLIHCSNNFLYNTPLLWDAPEWLHSLDKITKSFLYFAFEGKAYAIFALLFGFTFSLQYENQRAKGKDFSLRMAWRMVLLIGFGVINAAFFAGGDPLVFYALAMFIVIPLIRLKTKHLIPIAALFLLQPIEIANHIQPFLSESYISYYGQMAERNAGANIIQIFYNNITLGLQGCLMWAIETGRFTQTLGLFILGIIVHRVDFFKAKPEYYTRLLAISLCLASIAYFAKTTYPSPLLTMYYNLFSSAVIVNLFMKAYHSNSKSPFWNHFIVYGKMSLTNFIGQSVICSSLFYSWGLHLTQYCGAMLSIVIGILVLIFQIKLSHLWLKRHSKGPLENLWHKLTWINLSP